jgi:hypothetical protein
MKMNETCVAKFSKGRHTIVVDPAAAGRPLPTAWMPLANDDPGRRMPAFGAFADKAFARMPETLAILRWLLRFHSMGGLLPEREIHPIGQDGNDYVTEPSLSEFDARKSEDYLDIFNSGGKGQGSVSLSSTFSDEPDAMLL